MKLVHDSYGETIVDSQREANRLAQYGWVRAEEPSPKPESEKPSRKRKPVEEQPELPLDESSNLVSE